MKVLVPATTANLGPGFDCLGMALALYQEIQLEEIPHGLEVEIDGEGAAELAHDAGNLVLSAAQRVFDRVGYQPTGLRLCSINRIPMMGGLGSSSAAIVGGLVAANALVADRLTHHPLTNSQLLDLAIEIEGHPDNVAPALLGGLVIVAAGNDGPADDHGPIVERVEVADLTVVVINPDLRVATKTARRILPTQIPRADAIFNAGRVALVTLALSRGDLDLLGRAMDDRLHQPLRKYLIIGYDDVLSAAKSAGAAAIAISGSGPSLIAFAADRHAEIAAAMTQAFAANHIDARTWILKVDRAGARVVS
ncbi:MAG TPA: homoserine kinase [Anaerolineae bacterium]|nr:homoserine kinase [Anaerolineae bacterium]